MHIPVMLREVIDTLAPRDGAVYLDGTFGGGGYARAILDAAACTLWALDRDPDAVARAAALAQRYPGRLHVLHGRFGDLLALMHASGIAVLDGIVLDLGLSSFQIDDARRGFSFRADGPLDMRMGAGDPDAADREAGDQEAGDPDAGGVSAAELVATLSETELADTLFELGEERHARRIARAIVAARQRAPIATTGQLASIVRAASPPDRAGIDPATRSFQALRIRVNDELGEISRALEAAAALLSPGGRLVVVSFHSLEDRLVKRFMAAASGRDAAPSRHDPAGLRQRERPCFALMTARARRPSESETAANPRARSARLRAMRREATA